MSTISSQPHQTKRALTYDTDDATIRSSSHVPNDVLGISSPLEAQLERSIPTPAEFSYAYPHSASLLHCQVSPKGLVVTATSDGLIHIWHIGKIPQKSGGTGNNSSVSTTAQKASTPHAQKLFESYLNNLQLDYVIGFAAHADHIIALCISPCGETAVSVDVTGHVVILDLKSCTMVHQFLLPFLPASICLVEDLLTPTDAAKPSLQTRYDPTSLALMVGTFRGDICIINLANAPIPHISAAISHVSALSITSLTAIPATSFLYSLSQNHTEDKRYPPSQLLPGWFLAWTDSQGNIDFHFVPRAFCSRIDITQSHDTEPQFDSNRLIPSSLTTSASSSSSSSPQLDRISLHIHSTLLSAGIPIAPLPDNPSPSNTQPHPLQRIMKIASVQSVLYWGSLDHNIFFSPSASVSNPALLFPQLTQWSLKSRTDLWHLRKQKQTAISIQFSPNAGASLLVTALDFNPPTTSSFIPLYIYAFDPFTGKIASYCVENSAQYPHCSATSLQLSSGQFFHNDSETTSTSTIIPPGVLTKTAAFCSQPLEACVVDDTYNNMLQTVSLVATSAPTTTLPNKYFIPASHQKSRILAWNSYFSTALDQIQISCRNIETELSNLLATPTSWVPSASPLSSQEGGAATPKTTASFPPQLPPTLLALGSNSATMFPRLHALALARKPFIGVSHTSTSALVSDIISFHPSGQYFLSPCLSGLKCVRLRDQFLIRQVIGTCPNADVSPFFSRGVFIPSSVVYHPPTTTVMSYSSSRPTAHVEEFEYDTIFALADEDNSRLYQFTHESDTLLGVTNSINSSKHVSATTASDGTASALHTRDIINPNAPVPRSQNAQPHTLDSLTMGSFSEPMVDKAGGAESKLIFCPPFNTTTNPCPDIIEQSKLIPHQLPTRAVLHTSHGDITIDLFPQQAPLAVYNFSMLALKGYYSHSVFHRVIRDFMIQTGSNPLGEDASIWGRAFPDEVNQQPSATNHTLKHITGVVSMANAGPVTNMSQFFIVTKESHHLNGKHTIFGRVSRGMDVVLAIEHLPTLKNDRPREPPVIKSIDIYRN